MCEVMSPSFVRTLSFSIVTVEVNSGIAYGFTFASLACSSQTVMYPSSFRTASASENRKKTQTMSDFARPLLNV